MRFLRRTPLRASSRYLRSLKKFERYRSGYGDVYRDRTHFCLQKEKLWTLLASRVRRRFNTIFRISIPIRTTLTSHFFFSWKRIIRRNRTGSRSVGGTHIAIYKYRISQEYYDCWSWRTINPRNVYFSLSITLFHRGLFTLGFFRRRPFCLFFGITELLSAATAYSPM